MSDARARLVLDDAAHCLACPRIAMVDPPPRERIAATTRWAVAHAYNANLEGWVVVLPVRHVVSVDALDDAEARELGPMLRGVSAALRAVVGCEKTYVLQLAESEGFNHVHFHVVPRRADLPEAFLGPRIFGLLGSASLDVVDPARMDDLARRLRAHLVAAGVATSP
jgi:diadenosine tetraphosphate (Ap4A) HIT family hydrolase